MLHDSEREAVEIADRLQRAVSAGTFRGRWDPSPAFAEIDASVAAALNHVDEAFEEPPVAPVTSIRRPLLGELMVSRGIISAEQLDDALVTQRRTGGRLGETLVELGVITRADMTKIVAEQLGVPFADVQSRSPDPAIAALVPEDTARRYRVLPIEEWDDQLLVAMADPKDVFAIDDLHVLTGRRVVAALADREHLDAAIERIYQHSEIVSSVDDAAHDFLAEDTQTESEIEVGESPVVRLVSALLDQAIGDRASDIHVEPLSEIVRVRFRIDGLLHPVSETPLSVLRPLVTRIKVLGGLDIAQSRVPQDGRFSLTLKDRKIDVRVETIPTATGEAVVLRLLDTKRGVANVDVLGLTRDEQLRLVPAFHASNGGIFVTGPTGSGKTSTLYAMLSEINTDEKSIVSVEDPVEYRLDGIKQMQINRRAGMTFAGALRAILRADPDVIFVGEVRDGETARIAADASITGHLVVSTLHATRAATAPARLTDMGVEPYLVAAALSCVATQRLARRLCEHCAVPVEGADVSVLRQLGADDELLANGAAPRQPVGCPECRGTGYYGRLPLFEIMPVTEGIARLIVERAASADIERLAIEEGMDTLRRAALRRVLQGVLSIDEMVRVIS